MLPARLGQGVADVLAHGHLLLLSQDLDESPYPPFPEAGHVTAEARQDLGVVPLVVGEVDDAVDGGGAGGLLYQCIEVGAVGLEGGIPVVEDGPGALQDGGGLVQLPGLDEVPEAVLQQLYRLAQVVQPGTQLQQVDEHGGGVHQALLPEVYIRDVLDHLQLLRSVLPEEVADVAHVGEVFRPAAFLVFLPQTGLELGYPVGRHLAQVDKPFTEQIDRPLYLHIGETYDVEQVPGPGEQVGGDGEEVGQHVHHLLYRELAQDTGAYRLLVYLGEQVPYKELVAQVGLEEEQGLGHGAVVDGFALGICEIYQYRHVLQGQEYGVGHLLLAPGALLLLRCLQQRLGHLLRVRHELDVELGPIGILGLDYGIGLHPTFRGAFFLFNHFVLGSMGHALQYPDVVDPLDEEDGLRPSLAVNLFGVGYQQFHQGLDLEGGGAGLEVDLAYVEGAYAGGQLAQALPLAVYGLLLEDQALLAHVYLELRDDIEGVHEHGMKEAQGVLGRRVVGGVQGAGFAGDGQPREDIDHRPEAPDLFLAGFRLVIASSVFVFALVHTGPSPNSGMSLSRGSRSAPTFWNNKPFILPIGRKGLIYKQFDA